MHSAYIICKQNTFSNGFVGNGLGTLNNIKLVIDSCIFNEKGYQNYNENIIVKNCEFYWNNKSINFASPILGGTFYNCKFYDYTCEKGHIADFIGYNCEIYNMSLAGLQGTFYLDNCKVEHCLFSNYTKDIQISIINNCNINNFIFNYVSWAKCNIYYKAIDSNFNNNDVRKNILDDSFAYFNNTKEFIIQTSHNTYVDKTVIANQSVLDNTNINFDSMM